MKKILIGLLIIILALAGAAYFLLGNLNSIVKEQIEKHGSSALQTSVKVADVNIKLLDGLGEITGFSVANPQGFSQTAALSFNNIRLDIGTDNITEMPIVIEEIMIDSVATLYELNAQAKGNLNVLLDQLTAGSSSDSSESKEPSEASSEKSDIRIVIKKLVIKDTKLALDLSALGDKKYAETLPTFAVNNIGGTQGLPPEALGQAIGKSLLNTMIKQAKEKQTEKLTDKVKEKAMEKLQEKGGEKLKGLMDRFGG
tara:strand:- start:21208 stop:21975 length:768 start_codon:yes stop_codon:yes gene_type:complete